jgi:cell division protein FtsB
VKKKNRILRFFRNKYVLTVTIFLVWMTFFDNNDIFRQYRIERKKQELTQEYNRRKKLIAETNERLRELRDRKLLEKFAREEYLFKRPNEEVFQS